MCWFLQDWPAFLWSLQQARFRINEERTTSNSKESKVENKGLEAVTEGYKPATMGDVLAAVLADSFVRKSCPDLVQLAQLALAMTVYTVPCESGFSYLKLTKGPLRSLLGEDMLNASLFAQLEGPSPEKFPSGEAVRVWYGRKGRRLSITNITACKDRPCA